MRSGRLLGRFIIRTLITAFALLVLAHLAEFVVRRFSPQLAVDASWTRSPVFYRQGTKRIEDTPIPVDPWGHAWRERLRVIGDSVGGTGLPYSIGPDGEDDGMEDDDLIPRLGGTGIRVLGWSREILLLLSASFLSWGLAGLAHERGRPALSTVLVVAPGILCGCSAWSQADQIIGNAFWFLSPRHGLVSTQVASTLTVVGLWLLIAVFVRSRFFALTAVINDAERGAKSGTVPDPNLNKPTSEVDLQPPGDAAGDE